MKKKQIIIIIVVILTLIGIAMFAIPAMLNKGSADLQNETVEEMDNIFVTSFNEKFIMYEGENVNGSSVKLLISTINQSNQKNNESNIKVNYNGDPYQQDLSVLENTIEQSSKYSITFNYDSTTQLVDTVNINER